MGSYFLLTCPECGKVWDEKRYYREGLPQQCPDCGCGWQTEHFDEDEPERGPNGINFGRDR